MEAATRPLLLAVLVGGLGWGTGLAFFLFSFFMMVRGRISCGRAWEDNSVQGAAVLWWCCVGKAKGRALKLAEHTLISRAAAACSALLCSSSGSPQIMYWTPQIRGIFSPIVAVFESPSRIAFVLYAVLVFPGFRNVCPEWMYLVGDDDRWHPLLFLVERTAEEAVALVLITTLTDFAPETSDVDPLTGAPVAPVDTSGTGFPLLSSDGQQNGLAAVQVRAAT